MKHHVALKSIVTERSHKRLGDNLKRICKAAHTYKLFDGASSRGRYSATFSGQIDLFVKPPNVGSRLCFYSPSLRSNVTSRRSGAVIFQELEL